MLEKIPVWFSLCKSVQLHLKSVYNDDAYIPAGFGVGLILD